ncbi:hypothetical protein DFJ77DRAFT_476174 [Powellomyces hirtus]|nr:hypothetical protein DFJ77DRAFT_476174 [Powellomyces hirtus]
MDLLVPSRTPLKAVHPRTYSPTTSSNNLRADPYSGRHSAAARSSSPPEQHTRNGSSSSVDRYDVPPDQHAYRTPARRSQGEVVYAASSQRRSLTQSSSGMSLTGAQTPFQRATSLTTSQRSSVNERRERASATTTNTTPYPDSRSSAQRYEDEGESDASFIDDDFKQMVEKLGAEELTHLEGLTRGREHESHESLPQTHALERNRSRDTDRGMMEAAVNQEKASASSHAYSEDDNEYDLDSSLHEAFNDSADEKSHFLDDPTMDLLDAEFEDSQFGFGGEEDDENYQKIEGLEDLDLTGMGAPDEEPQDTRPPSPEWHDEHIGSSRSTVHHAVSRQDLDDSQMREFWEHAAEMATPTPAGHGRIYPARRESPVPVAELRFDDHEGQQIDDQEFREVRGESPESSLGVLSDCEHEGEPEAEILRLSTSQKQHASPPPSEHEYPQRHASGPELRTFPSPYGAEVDQISEPELDNGGEYATSESEPHQNYHHQQHHEQYQQHYKQYPSDPFIDLPYPPESEPSRAPSYRELPRNNEDEIHSLRALNERLLQTCEELKGDLEAALHEKERQESALQQEYERQLQEREEDEAERYRLLHEKLAAAEDQLERAHQAQDQISTIRASLQQEKELDILNIKKDLAEQKERELHDLRRAMAADKDDVARQVGEEMRRQQQAFQEERERADNDLQRLRRLLKQKDDEARDLEEQLYTRPPRKPPVETQDFCQQCEINNSAAENELEKLRNELETLQRNHQGELELVRQQQDQERTRARDQLAKLYDTGKQLEEETNTLRRETASLKTHHEREVQSLRHQLNEELTRVNAMSEQEESVKREKDRLELELAMQKSQYDREVQALRIQLDEERDRPRPAFDADTNDLRREIENLQQEISVLKSQYDRDVGSLRSQLEQERSNHDESVRREMNSLERDMAAQKIKYEREVHALRIELEDERNRPQETFTEEAARLKRQIENLRRETEGLRNNHQIEVDSLQQQLEDERIRSRDQIAKLQQKQRYETNLTAADLRDRFPAQMDQVRDELWAELQRRETGQQHSNRSLMQRHEQELKHLSNQHTAEIEALKSHHAADIQRVSLKLKKQCAAAYDLAVRKSQQEFAKSEEMLRKQMERHKLKWEQEHSLPAQQPDKHRNGTQKRTTHENRSRHHDMDGFAEAELNNPADDGDTHHRQHRHKPSNNHYQGDAESTQQLLARIAHLETTNRTLSESLAESAAHLRDAESHRTHDLAAMIAAAKQKYLATLKTMRDDLARSKKTGIERLEQEWKRRREELDAEWSRRLEEVKEQYQASAATTASQPRTRGPSAASSPPMSRRTYSSESLAARRAAPVDRDGKAVWKPPGPGTGAAAITTSADNHRQRRRGLDP